MDLVERRETEFGVIRVERRRTDGSFIYMQGTGVQSWADATGESLLRYVLAACRIIEARQPANALVIGCAGGSLPTMLHRRGVAVTTVDVNPHAFDLATRFFHLPLEVECRVGDGHEFLVRDTRCWDVIMLDAYDGEAMPGHFMAGGFLADAARRLGPGGWIIVNVVIETPDDVLPDDIAALMRQCRLEARIYGDAEMFEGNCLVVAAAPGDCGLRRLDSALRAAGCPYRGRVPRPGD
ncbi:MAG: fused MFS/spermidine synthase [Alphaproteobacteria bacterium]|jgi:SAM-dependent methyltransferase|nr:fused MFS/spermidine synthase [Alphaproteobacteria bacterium]